MPVLRVFTRFSVKLCRGALQNDLQHEKACLSRSKKKRAGLVVWVERVGLELGEIRRPARETNILGRIKVLSNKNRRKIPLYF